MCGTRMEEVCIVDSGTTNTILREKKYFHSIRNSSGKVMTVTSSDKCIIGSEKVTIILTTRTILHIEEVLL